MADTVYGITLKLKDEASPGLAGFTNRLGSTGAAGRDAMELIASGARKGREGIEAAMAASDPTRLINAFSQVKRTSAELAKEFQDTNKAIADVAIKLRANPGDAALTREFNQLKQAAKAAKEEMLASREVAELARRGLATQGVSVANLAADYRRLKADASKGGGKEDFAAVSKGADALGNKLQSVSRAGIEAGSSMQGMGNIGSRAVDSLAARFVALLAPVVAVTAAFRGAGALINAGFEANSGIEQARLGIASLITAQSDLRDSHGKLLTGTSALNAAMTFADEQMNKLRIAGLNTSATFAQLSEAYQQAVGAGLSAGLNLDEIRQITVGITQAAGALGVPMNQLNQEVVSILNGTIDMNSRVGKSLQISNEMVKSWKEQGVLAERLNERMQAFATAGSVANGNWVVMKSNMEEAFSVMSGNVTSGMFDKVKGSIAQAMSGVFDLSTAKISDQFKGLSDTLTGLFDGIGSAASTGIDAMSAGVQNLSRWLSENKQVVGEIGKSVKHVASMAWDAAAGMARFFGMAVDGAAQIGLLSITFKAVEQFIAAIKDGITFIGAGVVKLGALLLDYAVAPMASLVDLAGRAMNAIKAGSGDALTGHYAAVKAASAEAHRYASGVVADFANGNNALAQTTRQWREVGAAAADAKNKTGAGATVNARPGEDKPGKGADTEGKHYASLIQSANDRIAALEAETTATGRLTEAEKQLAVFVDQIASGTTKLTAAHQESVRAKLEGVVAAERARDAHLAEQKAREDMLKGLDSETESIRKQAAAAIEETAMLGKSKEEIARIKSERDSHTIAIMDERLATLDAAGACTAETEALREQIRVRRDLKAAQEGKVKREVEVDAAKKAADEFDNRSKEISRILSDALMRGFESGKGFAANFGDTVKNLFRTMILEPRIKATVAPLANALNKIIDDFATGIAKAMSQSNSNGGSWMSTAANFISTLFSANGNAFTSSGVQAFANGGAFTGSIVSSATPFKFANGGGFGLGVMGEAGPEAVMPLTRTSGGKLGVLAEFGGRGSPVPSITFAPQINVINNTGTAAAATTRPNSSGGMDIILEHVESGLARNVQSGRGPLSGAMENTYGLNRAAGAMR